MTDELPTAGLRQPAQRDGPAGTIFNIWYNKWSGVVFIGTTLVVTVVYYLISGRASRERIGKHLPHARGF